ncbi:MAG: ribosomal subunit interface protein [Candidatus Zambryskibacteria bacterium RIFCSPLOWO2_02_FULL_51_21]|uniref:Ribosomal subunit interface protein n=1 Tax=Candidatus Zambryskibacteria bacterium RIFCSPHIGHO2_02_FULL_43_37 TaxID=1802749 RepID=A0A1G2THH1_9BACT|nr:MAG: ribosomal subunit interface protein [Candidatus Zambryskibacteria bacterium RIFCSPHIGHO2_01_FULL_52_18]OHA96508.1 MAG: ribosomal subunit interface protein [Candidatus Zambryskibacteria bacterium RIFCSPHIGHO2_02_FULL_43_37]OHB07178.1 MAG: ribosomal subunit interface protein [Candidatus Zambryskibacteria bacterium RIFCSPLOWO2_01_FULL_52_12]OHB11228.1 MAG: ribosomal subunit interface protein [Candidatus Zambryskibacteria bacterium RIFCSPLOWO2_02_FULL_51_21]
MKINIKATGIELTPAISEYVNKKVGALEKYVKNADAVASVEVGRSTQHHKTGEVFMAEVHLTGAGLDLYAVAEHSDLYAAIDLVKDEVKETLLQEKGRRETLLRRGARKVKDLARGMNIFKKRS